MTGHGHPGVGVAGVLHLVNTAMGTRAAVIAAGRALRVEDARGSEAGFAWLCGLGGFNGIGGWGGVNEKRTFFGSEVGGGVAEVSSNRSSREPTRTDLSWGRAIASRLVGAGFWCGRPPDRQSGLARLIGWGRDAGRLPRRRIWARREAAAGGRGWGGRG